MGESSPVTLTAILYPYIPLQNKKHVCGLPVSRGNAMLAHPTVTLNPFSLTAMFDDVKLLSVNMHSTCRSAFLFRAAARPSMVTAVTMLRGIMQAFRQISIYYSISFMRLYISHPSSRFYFPLT